MTVAVDAAAAEGTQDRLAALHQRLSVAAATLGLPTETAPDTTIAVSQLYGRLVEHVQGQETTDGLWLLLVALAGVLPQPEHVKAAVRARDLRDSGHFASWLLEETYDAASAGGTAHLEMDVVDNGVVVDVDFSGTQELHTGIQRVVRETVPHWHREHELTLAVWTAPEGAMRHLLPHERDRILRWHERRDAAPEDRETPRHRLVVPWHSWVLLPETLPPDHCPGLAALSLYSGSRTALIGHDCIPVVSPELIHPGEADRFTRYLEVVKYAHRVAGVSESAAREFQGFVDMLAAQGLPGPSVVACPLAVEAPPGEPVADTGGKPLVVCIGTFEPRKNQIAVLHAAEQLWREGLEFRLEFIGGSGWASEFDAMLARLVSAGRPIRRRTAISDEQLWGTVRAARFTVLVTLHEGFGLPVAESLACGTPCLTSDFGATRETAEGGGALTVDPLDDQAIAAQMRRLLTDDELVASLREQALHRPSRTWADYARELWEALVIGEGTAAGAAR